MNRRSLIRGLGLGAAVLSIPSVRAGGNHGERIVIADARGDYGLLAPFTHRASGPGYLYTSYVFDTLIGQNREGFPTPCLASVWSISDDGRACELTLDGRARWHDGRPVTAADIAFTFAYLREHPYAFASVSGVEAVETIAEGRLHLRLAQPDAGFLFNTLMSLPILPRHIYEGRSAPEQFADPLAATGSGPYRLTRYDKAQGRYRLERHPAYHLGLPRFSQLLIVRMMPDTAIEAMKRGEVDIVPDLPFELVGRAGEAGLTVISAASGHVERLVLNHRGVFAAREIRRALSDAIDRRALVDIVYAGAARPARPDYFQPGSPWCAATAPPADGPDHERAAALLSTRGWARDAVGRWHREGAPVTLRLVAEGRYKRLATVLAGQFDAFGLGVELRLMETASLQQQVQAEAFDLFLRATSTLGDPGAIAGRLLGASWTSDRFPDPGGRMAALLHAQARAQDPRQRRALLGAFAALYGEELPSLMLVDPVWNVAHNGRANPRFLPEGIAPGIPMALPKAMFFR